MTAAIAAMVFAGLETELAAKRQRAGDEARLRHHGGWALILFAVGLFLALMHWTFG